MAGPTRLCQGWQVSAEGDLNRGLNHWRGRNRFLPAETQPWFMHTERVDGRCCGVVWSKYPGTEPLSTALKQLTDHVETGIGRQRALSL